MKDVDMDCKPFPQEGPLCPLCANHCPLRDPSCHRGMAYARQVEEREAESEPEDLDRALRDRLAECGQLLRRGEDGYSTRKRVLTLLRERGNITQRELTEVLGLAPGSLSELMGKMEKQGQVRRRKSAEDRRMMQVMLTRKGLTDLKTMEQECVDLFADLTGEEKRQTCELLDKILGCGGRAKPAG